MNKVIQLKLIKRTLIPLLCILAIAFVFLHVEEISNKISVALEKNPEVIVANANTYKKTDNFLFVQNTFGHFSQSFV